MPIFFTKKSCNRGVEPPPQMPLSCQKRQMPLTVKKISPLIYHHQAQNKTTFLKEQCQTRQIIQKRGRAEKVLHLHKYRESFISINHMLTHAIEICFINT